MAKVIGKDVLCRVENFNKYFTDLQGISGKSLFERYVSLNTIVESYIDKEFQKFLAYPVQENENIIFFGKKYNETPGILSELTGGERDKYTKIKDKTLEHYSLKSTELHNSGKTDESEFLSGAIKFVDDRFVYCYDDIVVLGVWGMRLRENVREDISEIVVGLTMGAKPDSTPEPQEPTPEPPIPTSEPENFTITFKSGEKGKINGVSEFSRELNEKVSANDIPSVHPQEGFEFIGWDKNPYGHIVDDDVEFTAQYKEIPSLPGLPWYERLWKWLASLFAGKNCLNWLLRLLLLLLLLFLLLWLLKSCEGCNGHEIIGGGVLGSNDSTWVRDDPRTGNEGGIYDPTNPYKPVPTDPAYKDILPPQEGVLPPISDTPDIVPGNPNIFGNRLNILMENEDKSIMDLAKAFKEKYPEDKYKVVYYDNVVKRMQIEIPKEERGQLKQAIPEQFAPDYKLFVFDETLFESRYTPNDPAFGDVDKSWYLKAVNAEKGWDVTRGSEKVTIAIVDNGFNLNHPDLKGKSVQPYNVWKHSNEIFPQQEDHGTHIAGTAVAIANNGIGLCGIAPDCKFMPIQVADNRGMMTTTSVLDGILYALYQGADVVNVSLGSQFSNLSRLSESTQKELIRSHFKEEERLWQEIMRIAAHHNSTIVLAAGNDNVLAGIDAIQRPELFITVSAVGKDMQQFNKALFSNYGDYSTLSAPGVGIFSSYGTDGYKSMDGTSSAAPIVSGCVALMKSIKPDITTKQIICILKETGRESHGNIGKLIQIDKALEKVKSGGIIECKSKPSTGDVQVLLSWNNYNDLDLICTDPSGECVFFRNRHVASGGKLDIDMNVEYPDSKTPVENIFWSPGSAPNGTYNVYLLYYRKHETSIDETPYNVTVKYGGKTEDYSGEIKKGDKPIHVCSFTVGIPGSDRTPPIPSSEVAVPDQRRSQLEQKKTQLQSELDRVNIELREIEDRR